MVLLYQYVFADCRSVLSSLFPVLDLPVGAITVLCILFTVPRLGSPPIPEAVEEAVRDRYRLLTGGRYCPKTGSMLFRWSSFDFLGFLFLLGAVVCLLIGLQWGGAKYEWSDPVIIGLLVAFGALVIILVAWERFGVHKSLQLVPLRYMKNRTVVGSILLAFGAFFMLTLIAYYSKCIRRPTNHADRRNI